MNADSITLNNGVVMQRIDYGVFRMTDAATCEEAVVRVVAASSTQQLPTKTRKRWAGQGKRFENETLCAIAEVHGKSVAQVVLRWLVQRNIVPLVKSANPQRMKENLNLFDFALTDAEMVQIAALDTGRTAFSPCTNGAEVEAFLKAAQGFCV